MTRAEMLRFLDFIEEVENEGELVLPLRALDPFFHITIFLIRQHLEAKLVTATALAAAARVPYATAVRRIDDMVAQGLIVRRPRTRTGKSFSLHPSQRLIDAWYDYARRIKRVIGKALGMEGDGPGHIRDYYFGGSYLSARIIPPPTVGAQPLGLRPPLRVLIHADPTFMAMESLKRQLEQVFGASIRNRALSIDRLREEALKNSAARQSHYDIIAVDLPWVGEFAVKDVLLPLDDDIRASGMNVSDFHPVGWQGCAYRGRQYGIPIQTTPELFFYRTDLFAEHGLDPPLTTGQVLDAARRLHRPSRGLRGVAWNAARGTAMGHTFLMIMGAAFGRPVLDLKRLDGGFDAGDLEGERLRPTIDTPEGRLTAEYLLELLAYSPPNILTMAWYERVVAYTRGEVAMSYGYTLLAPYFEFHQGSPARGNTGFLPHPTGPGGHPIAPVGGYVLGIPTNIAPERRDAAWRAVRFLTSAEAFKLYTLNGSLVSPRFSLSADPEVRALSPVFGAVDDMARAGLLQYWPRPPAPEIADVITICGEEMHDMARGLKSPAGALAAAQNRADRLMRSHGHY